MDPAQFDPTPAQDEAEWRDTERGLDARHAAAAPRVNGKPVRVKLDLDLSPAVYSAGYATRNLDVTLNRTAQRVVLKLLTESLIARQATLADGIPIRRPQEALQWLLEQIALGLPQKTLDQLIAGCE